MGEFVSIIMEELRRRNVKSLKQTEEALKNIESPLVNEVISEVLNNLINYIEKDRPDSFDIYLKIKGLIKEQGGE